MHNVFISFSFKDQPVVNKIVDGLEKNNISCWICTEQIRCGGSFYDAISEAITESKILVFVQTKNSVESKEIPDEIFQALDENKTIISFVVEDSELHGMMKLKLKSKQHIDARGARLAPKIDELATEIKKILGSCDEADSVSGMKTASSNTTYSEPDIAYSDKNTANDLFRKSKRGHERKRGYDYNKEYSPAVPWILIGCMILSIGMTVIDISNGIVYDWKDYLGMGSLIFGFGSLGILLRIGYKIKGIMWFIISVVCLIGVLTELSVILAMALPFSIGMFVYRNVVYQKIKKVQLKQNKE